MKHLKSSLVALAIAVLIIGGSAYASFPTKKQTPTEQTTGNGSSSESLSTGKFSKEEISSIEKKVEAEKSPLKMDEMAILLLLWFFLGFVAGHRWYAKKPIGWNILYILTLGGCGVWSIVDFVYIVLGDF